MKIIENADLWWVVRRVKTTDETVNNSDVMQNDNDLVLPMAADQVWLVFLVLVTNSAAAADLKYTWDGPVGCHALRMIQHFNAAGGSEGVPYYLTSAVEVEGTAGDSVRTIEIAVIVNPTNAGNLQLQWAQLTADVSDTKVLKGSSIIAMRLR